MLPSAISNRAILLYRGRKLEYFTVAWNAIEGAVAVWAGAAAGSISLVAFGVDSFIELASGTALLWRMSVDANAKERQRHEKRALRIVGSCFLLLALYILYESTNDLLHRHAPEHSQPGIVLACVALVIMPLLAGEKRKVDRALTSLAMAADAKQSQFCAYLSAILLAGLLLNAAFGLRWADPVAALVMLPLIAKEGVEGVRGTSCESCCSSSLPAV
jgi:divalent metal cation (Fe/Co/Zn/Cd) transporter